MKPLKDSFARTLGLVGCGHWGKNLARNFDDLGALHTICDADAAKSSSFREHYPDVNFVTDFQSLLDNDAIGQIAVATPAVLHSEMCRKALLAGKDVYVEKPFCLKVEEAEAIQSLEAELARIVMVGHLLQYHPIVCKLQEMMREKTFGKLFRITSNRLNLGKVRTEENALWSLAPHDISVVLSLTGSAHPISVRALHKYFLNRDVADCTTVDIEFSEGINAQIQVSWLHPFKEQKLCVIGESTMAVFDDTREWSHKLAVSEDYFNNREMREIAMKAAEPLRNECAHFLQCCNSRTNPKTDTAEAIQVLKILEAAERSATNGGRKIELLQQHPE